MSHPHIKGLGLAGSAVSPLLTWVLNIFNVRFLRHQTAKRVPCSVCGLTVSASSHLTLIRIRHGLVNLEILELL